MSRGSIGLTVSLMCVAGAGLCVTVGVPDVLLVVVLLAAGLGVLTGVVAFIVEQLMR